MALTYDLDFAIFYACVLALFSWLAFWFVPIAVQLTYAAAKNWLKASPPEDGDADGHGAWFEHQSLIHPGRGR
jgi:hypothetical protein